MPQCYEAVESLLFVLQHNRIASLPVGTLPLTFRYQICNDVTKLCYPPQDLTVPLPPSLEDSPHAIASTTARQPSTSLTLNERHHSAL